MLLLDLWAQEPGGIYADQTWMAAIGPPAARAAELWGVVREARDAALAAGYGDRIVCRTGHSIDRVGLHGNGPTIDDTETFDSCAYFPERASRWSPGSTSPAR